MMTKTTRTDVEAPTTSVVENGPIVRFRGVRKRLGQRQVLDGADIEIERGETRVILGRSGEGKSVLLKHICGLFRPDTGKIWLDGVELSTLTDRELFVACSKAGMLFQGAALFDSLNVEENVGFALYEHTRMGPKEIREIAERNLRMVKLEGVLDKMPSELSGGMRKRVGLARVITQEPDIILYDEPTTGLDPVTGDAINDLIVQLAQDLNITSVVVTHDMASAFKVGDKISMLLDGRIIYTGTVEETQKTENPYVRQFIRGLAHGPLTDNGGGSGLETSEASEEAVT